ncbi:crossover junction endodeoxyribonuclease RuvC [Bacteriovorax sp. PP10]|uniref:Crossover junction endodeoxyribonuclease RuvC n=1 Tax=Bacteriovorax antarcticus TaxID=3088717 RepID=A0ABU5VPD9_9BACT|nr:crossover junction endodeoxyribonuclease RuvC [Bacteriovorax sp. PP10]MEA9354910.1 crossover junction endodeoxyribonuclease RuvC [Bacteriovorax sp. PP10]
MIILGIDPGSRKAGYALIDVQGKKISYIASGVLKYDHVDEFLERLGMIYQTCDELMNRYQPDEVSVEALIYVKSVDALSKLAQARGAMIAAFSRTRLGKIYEYAPNAVKSSVTGHGHADKDAINKAMTMMFGKLTFKTSDESDALAIAVCHALNRNMKLRLMGKTV